MTWWGVGIGATLGVIKGKKNQDRMDANDKFRKTAIQYSPWTGMQDPGSQVLPGMLESGTQGAALGGMVGNSVSGASGAAPASTTGETTLGAAPAVNNIEGMKFTDAQMAGPQFNPALAPKNAGAMGGQAFKPQPQPMQMSGQASQAQTEMGPLELQRWQMLHGNN
jgi:hypothetical protein